MFATEILGAYPLFFASELIERLRYDVLNDKTNGYLGSKLGSQWIKNDELGLKWGGKPETHWNLTLMRHIHFSIEEGADLEMDNYKHVLFVLCSLAAWLWVP